MSSSDNNSYRTAIAVGFAIPIACIAVFLRLLARRVQKLSLGADDYVILVGAVFTIGNAVVFIFSNKYGNGRHINTLSPDELINYWKTNYAGYQIYGVALTLIKISILLFYRRIFATKQFRRWTNIVGFFVIAWFLVNNFLAAFQCNPISKAWLIELPGHCVDPLSWIIGIHSANIALDLVILALPVSAVLRLQMSTANKISVAGIFLLGGLSIVIAIIRLIVLTTANLDDITWYTSVCSWTAVEPAIEVLSVCLPAMAPLLQIRKVVTYIRTSLGSAVTLRKTSRPDRGHSFHNMDKYNQDFVPRHEQWSSIAAGTDRHTEPAAGFPLRGIVVTRDLEQG
ncbi:hypothetical protein MMC11_007287 [Xylographa trunciseda]|nr:hypothetical protein [Xylographa trunciseda]